MKTGIELIAEERQEQIEKHGFSEKHDIAFNSYGELANAAEYLIGCDRNKFPFKWDLDYMKRFEKKSRIEKLVIAGAFLAAEIDRLQNINQ